MKKKNNNKDLLQQRLISILLYGAECWRGTQRDSQRLSGFHTSCLRTICRIYRPQMISNKKLHQRNITTVTKQRRWRWLGHVIKIDRDSIARTALRWTPESGRRKRGRRRGTWRRTIETEMKKTREDLERT